MWKYRTHDQGDENPRGLYRADGEWMAPLPFVHARIVRMSGSGRQTGTDYLMSGILDGPRLVISDELLRTGEWASVLDLALSADDKIQKAAATAIRDMAHRDAPRTTPTPRVQPDGMLSIPVPESLPDGYLATAPAPPKAAMDAWRKIVEIAARTPGGKVALILGASAFGPFMKSQRVQTHMIDAFGEGGKGKSTTLRAAGGIWGDSMTKGAGTVIPWDISAIGVGRHAGQLGCLPMLLDESGMADMDAVTRAKFLLRLCESGGARMTAERIGTGVRRGLPWAGVVVNTGNGAWIDERAVAGRHAGVLRRVIALDTATPFTATAEDAQAIDEQVERGFGHLGHRILRGYSTHDAGDLLTWARQAIGTKSREGHGRLIADLLASHIAGAAMLDQICETGTALQTAAITAARDYLAVRGRTPDSDAQRLIEAVREAIATTPGDWPTKGEYEEWHRPRPEWAAGAGSSRRELPQHGVNREVSGVCDGDTVVVAPPTWHRFMDELGTDATLVFQTLARLELIHVAPSLRKRGEWKSSIRTEGGRFYGYRITLPPVADDDQECPEPGPQTQAPDSPGGPLLANSVETELAAWISETETLIRGGDAAYFRSDAWRAVVDELLDGETAGVLPHSEVARLRALHDERTRELSTPAPTPEPREVTSAAPAGAERTQVPAPRSASESPRRSHRTTDLPQLDTAPVEKARKAETPEQGEGIVTRAAIKEGMRLVNACRQGGRYTFVVRPPMPDELKRRGPKTPDVVWECRPKWENPAIEVGTEVHRLDTNAAYLSALKCWLPIGALDRRDGADYDPREHSGILLIEPPEWAETDMPNPLGARQEPGQVWVPDPVVRQYLRLAKEGRCDAPVIREALISSSTENLFEKFRMVLAKARTEAIETGDSLLETYVKSIYSKVISTMGESSANWEIQRQDMMHCFRSQAFMNLWRKADTARKAGLVVAKISNTDELHVIGDWTTVFTEGRALSETKNKGSYKWGVKEND